MGVVYSILISLYGVALRLAALFNKKARSWCDGRRSQFVRLESAMAKVDREKNPVIWFHVSSLGEFEQGRPVIEAMKARWPEKRILLTFFSPSGYEVRKNYDRADFIFYMPLDTPGNARRFLDIVKPEAAFFVKYDFWFNIMQALHLRRIPLYYISALFRPGQHFFQWYGGWFAGRLRRVTCFFVQNEESAVLLERVGIHSWMVTGDTRFDRVAAIAALQEELPLIRDFRGDLPLFVAGSSWEPDEAVIFPLIREHSHAMKYIIAPHDTSPARIAGIREKLGTPSICFSELTPENTGQYNVLVIDSVGILSKIYRYAAFAFIGGGFGRGLHNIQEPVTFGVPVFFGPGFGKFREARDLITLGGAVVIRTSDELKGQVATLMHQPEEHQLRSSVCRNYVKDHSGATSRIMDAILQDRVFQG